MTSSLRRRIRLTNKRVLQQRAPMETNRAPMMPAGLMASPFTERWGSSLLPPGVSRTARLRSTVSRLAISAAVLGVPVGVIFMPARVQAQNECGVGSVVVCDNSGVPPTNLNPYANGITYDNAPAGQSVTFGPGVVVNTNPTVFNGLSVQNSSGAVTINTVSGTITTAAGGISGNTGSGALSITTGNITTSGAGFAAVFGFNTGNGPVFIDTRAGAIVTSGDNSLGVLGESFNGQLTILTGAITAPGSFSSGVAGYGFGSEATLIDTRAGAISTGGFGVQAEADGPLTVLTGNVSSSGGSATGGSVGGVYVVNFADSLTMVDTTAGSIVTTGDNAIGVRLLGLGAGSLTVATANVATSGLGADGVSATSFGGGPISINTTAGQIVTAGNIANGIVASSSANNAITIASGDVTTQGARAAGISIGNGGAVDSTAGTIRTAGVSSAGIFAVSTFPDYVANIRTGAITTMGDGAFGVAAAALSTPPGASGAVTVTNTAPITASGAGAGGIVALSFASGGAASGPVTINANADITATGQNAVGISATSGTNSVNVTVASGVTVVGGWSANPSDLSTQLSSVKGDATIGSNLPAAGIVVYSGATPGATAMTIDNFGSIGALNDRAITMGFPCAVAGENGPATIGPCVAGMSALQSLTVNNGGTVTGYVTLLGDAVHTFNNAGTFNMRNFAETTANGQRDTLGVAVSNFGVAGGIFNNLASGVVQPLHVANPATINPTGQYIPTTGIDSRPLESSVYSMTQNPAITQSQFVNVATFNNAGTINLQNGVPGDVFVITGNPVAGGTPGTGVFVSNGGRLLVDATLNSGIPSGGQSNSIADVLVVDSTRVGAGATQVFVNNVGGLGAQTSGNGVEIVEVRNKQPGMSAGGAFALGGPVAAGAFAYDLFQNGVGADTADGNWYLRSAGFRPEVPVDTVTPALAARLGLATLASASVREDDFFSRYGGFGPGQICADEVETPQPGVYVKAPPPKVACNTLLWGRVFGETGSAGSGGNGNGGFGSAGPAYTFDYGGLQAGADLYRTARDKAGLYADAATLQSNVNGANGGLAGRVGLDAYGVGGYWTHRDPTGWYTDLVLQGHWYENIHANSVAGQSFDTQGWGLTASAEAGYQIALGDGFGVIPQGQLIYQRTSIDGGADQFGRISYGATDEIYGRLGARFAKGWLTNDGRTVSTWVDTNFWHQFGDDAKTTFTNLQGLDPTTVAASLGGTWAQIGLGLSGQLTRNVSIFGRTDYNIAIDQPGHSIGARAGIRVVW